MLRRKSTNTSEEHGCEFSPPLHLHSWFHQSEPGLDDLQGSSMWTLLRSAPALGEVCLCWQSVHLFCTETLPTPSSLVHKLYHSLVKWRETGSPPNSCKRSQQLCSHMELRITNPAWPLQCGQTYQRAEHSHPALRKPGSVQLSTSVSPKVTSPRWTSGLMTSSILNRLALLYNRLSLPGRVHCTKTVPLWYMWTSQSFRGLQCWAQSRNVCLSTMQT